MRASLASSLLASLVPATVLAAQVPPGHYVVSSFANGIKKPGGLFFVHPRIAGKPTVIRGLSAELTTGPTSKSHGANAVAIRPDGSIVVGEIGQNGVQIDLHWLLLAGNRVVLDTKTPIGKVQGSYFGGGIQSIAALPDGRVLLGVGHMNTAPLLLVDPARRTVVPVRTNVTGFCNAVAIDATGKWAFFAIGLGADTIYRVPLPAGGTAIRVGRVFGNPAMAVDHRGRLIHGSVSVIQAMDPRNGRTTRIGPTGNNVNAIHLERATDRIVFALNGYGSEGPAVKVMNQSGQATTLTNALTGVPSGIAVRHTPATYGAGTAGAHTYRWLAEPNAGGLPRLGHSSFSLTVKSSGPSAAGLAYVSTATDDQKLLGVRVQLRTSTLWSLGPVPASGRLHLPIPTVSSLVGAWLFVQSFHADAGAPAGIAATEGLQLGFLR